MPRVLTTEQPAGQIVNLAAPNTPNPLQVLIADVGGGGGGSIAVTWLSLVGIPDLTVDGANNNVMRPIGGAVAGDFQLTTAGLWALGDQCVLTYSGPPTTALVWASASPSTGTSGGGDSGIWCHAVSHNGDLLGGPVLNGDADIDAALRVAGGIAASFGLNNDSVAITTQRLLALATGDTVQPTIGKDQNIVGNQGFLEAFSLFVVTFS